MSFTTDRQLKALIAAYFKYIKGEYHLEDTPAKGKGGDEMVKQKIWDREPEAPTISGLAHYLGFDSRDAFNQYELTGEFASTLKRSRLRIEAEYEKKLHQQPSSGAIFALKNLGWHERVSTIADEQSPVCELHIEVIEGTIPPASSEKEVSL